MKHRIKVPWQIAFFCIFSTTLLFSVPVTFNNDGLEKTITAIWEHAVIQLSTILQRSIRCGITKKTLDRQQLLNSCIADAIKSVSLDAAVTNPQEKAVIRPIMQRILEQTLSEMVGKDDYFENTLSMYLLPFTIAVAADNTIQHDSSKQAIKALSDLIDIVMKLETADKEMLADWTSKGADRITRGDEFRSQLRTELNTLADRYSNNNQYDIANFIRMTPSLIDSFDFLENPTLEKISNDLATFKMLLTMVLNKYSSDDQEAKTATAMVERIHVLKKGLSVQPSDDLTWCGCDAAPFAKRIALILHIANDTERLHPDKKKRLNYVSFASGSLLQDYLIVQELKTRDYSNIDINCIDMENHEPLQLRQMIARAYDEEQQIHLESSLEQKMRQGVIQNNFINKLGIQFVWTSPVLKDKGKNTQPGLYATFWDDAKAYQKQIECNASYAADIAIFTDPFSGISEADSFIKANSFVLVREQEKLQHKKSDGNKLLSSHECIYGAISPRNGLELYTNTGEKYSIIWVNDPYIDFMKLVIKSSKANARVYTLDNGTLFMADAATYQTSGPAISPTVKEVLEESGYADASKGTRHLYDIEEKEKKESSAPSSPRSRSPSMSEFIEG